MSDQTTGPVERSLEQSCDNIESRKGKETTHEGRSSSTETRSILAMLFALVAIGIASWPAYEIYKDTQLGARIGPILARVAGVEAGFETLGIELLEVERLGTEKNAEMDARVAAHEAMAQQSLAEVTESLATIKSQIGTSSQHWVYAEVEYLVRMANQRVLIKQDVNAALLMLESADEIIQETDGLAAHNLRDALARDIASLKAVGLPDTEGIYLELSALILQVPLLSRTPPTYQAPISTIEQRPDATSYFARFLELIRHAGNRLAYLVDFRHGEVAVKPILAPREEYFLRQNVVSKLQIAQMALLEGNQVVFQSALGEAEIWVADSFDRENTGTVAMLKAITTLSASQVSVALPDIDSSLKAVRSLLTGFREPQPK
jgi:uroporphyrin-3 C-methyltransferase